MKPTNVTCPECGGPMVSRKSQHGVFWGCRAYPQCKGTRDSMGLSKDERRHARSDAEQEENQTPYRWDR